MELWVEGFTGDEENPEREPEVSAGSPAQSPGLLTQP